MCYDDGRSNHISHTIEVQPDEFNRTNTHRVNMTQCVIIMTTHPNKCRLQLFTKVPAHSRCRPEFSWRARRRKMGEQFAEDVKTVFNFTA